VSNTVAGVDMRGFATRLRHAREAAALSQRALAAQAGVNLGNYNELEQAQRTGLRVETLLRVCQVLGVSADSLLGLTDDPRPRPRRKRPAQADAGEREGAAGPAVGPLGDGWYGPPVAAPPGAGRRRGRRAGGGGVNT
jgi:transcriptional regulator with XRE-family HTH domain